MTDAFAMTVRPRYGEVDRMGVVYHAHYLVYFDSGRTELLRRRGLSYAEIEAGGHRLVVVEAAVRYRAPARYDEALRLEVTIEDVRPASVLFGYVLRRAADGLLLATGTTRLGCLDEAMAPARLPTRLRDGLGAGAGSRTGRPSSESSS